MAVTSGHWPGPHQCFGFCSEYSRADGNHDPWNHDPVVCESRSYLDLPDGLSDGSSVGMSWPQWSLTWAWEFGLLVLKATPISSVFQYEPSLAAFSHLGHSGIPSGRPHLNC